MAKGKGQMTEGRCQMADNREMRSYDGRQQILRRGFHNPGGSAVVGCRLIH